MSTRQRSFSAGLDKMKGNQLGINRYKTEMCRPFQEYGFCRYGDKCQFAHGTHELRPLPRHPKYKTEYCKTFYSEGYCPYGARCHFIHGKAEARQGPPTLHLPTSPKSILPPLSPSQDSGISSPDETSTPFLDSFKFEFPLSDQDTETLTNDADTFSDCDSLCSDTLSPNKPLSKFVNDYRDLDLSERLSSISLDETCSINRCRLPIFDTIFNSSSDTTLDNSSLM